MWGWICKRTERQHASQLETHWIHKSVVQVSLSHTIHLPVRLAHFVSFSPLIPMSFPSSCLPIHPLNLWQCSFRKACLRFGISRASPMLEISGTPWICWFKGLWSSWATSDPLIEWKKTKATTTSLLGKNHTKFTESIIYHFATPGYTYFRRYCNRQAEMEYLALYQRLTYEKSKIYGNYSRTKPQNFLSMVRDQIADFSPPPSQLICGGYTAAWCIWKWYMPKNVLN